jgi:hypothetical protein
MKALQPHQQIRKSGLGSVPYDIEVDIKIAMGDAITHPSHAAPRNLGIASDEVAMLVHDSGSRLANYDEAHNYCLLSSLIGKEIFLAHSIDEAARVACGHLHLTG